MAPKSAYIISLKFAPGLNKEIVVLGENIRKRKINVRYLLSEKYVNLEGKPENVEYITTANSIQGIMLETLKYINSETFMRIFSAHPPHFLCFYNPHPLNPFIARLARTKFPEVTLSLYLHDPYKSDKKPYGTIKATYITLAEFIQGLTVRYMDHVIFPSDYSAQIFEKRYPKFKGEIHIAPLLVPDQVVLDGRKRRFFSMVGCAHQATGHDTFIELVNYVAANGLDYEFALISSSNISRCLDQLSCQGQKILKVIRKGLITDSEINGVIRESYAVFRLAKEVTQSGVIPVSYMNATPVIVRDIVGHTQHVEDKHNGYIVSRNCTPEELITAMDFVKTNYAELAKNARKSYEEVWAECNWGKYYMWLMKILKSTKDV